MLFNNPVGSLVHLAGDTNIGGREDGRRCLGNSGIHSITLEDVLSERSKLRERSQRRIRFMSDDLEQNPDRYGNPRSEGQKNKDIERFIVDTSRDNNLRYRRCYR